MKLRVQFPLFCMFLWSVSSGLETGLASSPCRGLRQGSWLLVSLSNTICLTFFPVPTWWLPHAAWRLAPITPSLPLRPLGKFQSVELKVWTALLLLGRSVWGHVLAPDSCDSQVWISASTCLLQQVVMFISVEWCWVLWAACCPPFANCCAVS